MRFITSMLVVVLMLLAQAMPVQAKTVCSAGMITNTYGVSGETIIPDVGYCAVVGFITLLQDGTFRGHIKQSCAGMTMLSKSTGTYTVNKNCMATADVAFDDGTSGKFHFVLTEGGKTLLFIGDQQMFPGAEAPSLTFRGIGKQL